MTLLLNPLSRAAPRGRMGCQPILIWPAMIMIERCSGISRKANTCCLALTVSSRWLMGPHQGAVSHDHLDDYLNEFVFRFNRRKSASRGKLFFRLAQHRHLMRHSSLHNM